MHYDVATLLKQYASQYETTCFLRTDPSWYMHQVKGTENQEVTAFVASSLSYGNRKQFMPKIQSLCEMSNGDLYNWIKSGHFIKDIPDDSNKCFYRLYTYHTMHSFFKTLQTMLINYGSIGNFVKHSATDCSSAIKLITSYFASYGIDTIIPKNTNSACKRLCMFLRWMVRDNSPVDLGLWASFIDKRTLIIPLDTHVLHEAKRIGLINNCNASMSTAIKLTRKLTDIFPNDPLRGDFALYGYGVNH